MKIAHLILAHKDPEQLSRLIDRLKHPDADIYIHLDSKTDIGPFINCFKKEQVYLIDNRIKVSWGSYSIVQATINGFKQIVSAKKYQHINLLSVNDYPIKSTAYIHSFFAANPDKIYMEYLTQDSEWWRKIKTRVTKYHLTYYNFPGKYIIQKILNIFPDRTAPESLIFVGRSQWFSITEEGVKYILDYLSKNPKVIRFFRLTWGADEVALQTILYNSYLKHKIVNNNLRYIDWSEDKESPKILTILEGQKLLRSASLYARKFDMNTKPEILDYLDKEVGKTMYHPSF